MGATLLDAPTVPTSREWILDRIRAALRSRGVQLLVSGEPGIGKSFLLATALHGNEIAETVRFSEATRIGQRPLQTVKELLAIPADDTSTADGYNVYPSAFADALIDIARRGQTIVIENWQWVDRESRLLLQQAFRQPNVRASVSAVITARDAVPGVSLADDAPFAGSDMVVVPPIPRKDLREIIRGRFPGQLSVVKEAPVIEQSQGNPLWAVELTSARITNAPSGTVPPRITEILRARLDRVTPAGVRALQVVSALGNTRLSDSVRYLPNGAEGLPAALSAGVLTIDKGWIHPASSLLAKTSLALLNPAELAALYAELIHLPLPVAKRVELQDAVAGNGVDEHLADALYSAAMTNRQAGALRAAAHLARRALLRTAGDSVQLNERYLLAAEYALATGDIDAALDDLIQVDLFGLKLEAFDQAADLWAEALNRKGGEAMVRRRFGSILLRAGLPQPFRDIVEVYVISLARSRASADLSQLRAIDERLSAESVPLAKAAAKSALLEIQMDIGAGLDDNALRYLRSAEEASAPTMAERSADAIEGFFGYQVDDLVRSRAALHITVPTARASGENHAVLQSVAHLSIVETLSGQLSAAQAHLKGVAELEVALNGHLPASVYRAEALLALAHDEGGRVRTLASESFSPSGERRGELLRKSVLGLLAAQRGEDATAIEFLSSAVHAAEARGIVEPGRRMWIDVELVRALIRVGAHNLVPEAIARIEPAAQNRGRLHAMGQLDRLNALHLASTGEPESAIRLIDRGVSRILDSGFRLEAVRAHLDQAQIFSDAGKMARADDALLHAQKMNNRIQSASLGRAISRFQASRSAADLTSPLTASERRVVDLIVKGHSNRSAAAALHLSQRTIETHLSSVYRKTGIQSRTELVIRMSA